MNAPDIDDADDTLLLLRESLRRFVEREVVPHAAAWEAQGFVPREVLRRMGTLGFLGLRYPEEFGGGALDARATALLAEELGRSTFGGFAITVLVHTDMASPHLVNAGSPEQIRRRRRPAVCRDGGAAGARPGRARPRHWRRPAPRRRPAGLCRCAKRALGGALLDGAGLVLLAYAFQRQLARRKTAAAA